MFGIAVKAAGLERMTVKSLKKRGPCYMYLGADQFDRTASFGFPSYISVYYAHDANCATELVIFNMEAAM